MQTRTKTIEQVKKEEGFTLVEVIAVLVILGILAAVAIPKFFDMQVTARTKALEGAVGELNGQVALAFAQNALNGGATGDYSGLSAYLGPDFIVEIPDDTPTTAASNFTIANLESGTIQLAATPSSQVVLTWTAGTAASPGYFSIP